MTSPDLAALTGVRSGKRSYYRAYVRSDERLQQAVHAMDSISRALVRTVEGPRGLLEEVVRAAAEHLDAEWTILALADGHLTSARPRLLVADSEMTFSIQEHGLPDVVRREIAAIRAGQASEDDRWLRAPMTLSGERVGSLVGLHGVELAPDPDDRSVLRILANQAAISLHTSETYQAGLAAQRRAQRLYDEAQAAARDLDARTRELRSAEHRLQVAQQRELIDGERHRIARELHDSVTQYVLSSGMAIELARGDIVGVKGVAPDVVRRLETAKELSGQAVEQLRRAIYALHQPHGDALVTLPELVNAVAAHHRPELEVVVRVEGKALPLPADADHEIARAVGEALFNVASHARATRALVRVRYQPDLLRITVSDDGIGDPAELARLLRRERGSTDGHHRGLINIESRVADLGGSVTFRRSRLGGVRVALRVPLPVTDAGDGLIHNLVRGRPADPADLEAHR